MPRARLHVLECVLLKKLVARQNFGASFFPAYAAATCTTVILFFSVVQSNLCRFFSFRDMPKKNRAPGTRQVFLANFVAAYAIEILALFL